MTYPDAYYCDKAHKNEDDVQAKQQTIGHCPDHFPLLRGFGPLTVFVHLNSDGCELSA